MRTSSHPDRAASPQTHAGLTDRYVWAATQQLPERQRADVDSELRATIADMVDARLTAGPASAGNTEADAVSAVLTELGDPARLGAEYRDKPSYLIGPELYDTYLRLLRLLLSIVPAAAGGGVAVATLFAGDGIIEVMAGAVGVALTAALHVAFWTTLAFAIVERTGTEAPRRRERRWDLTQLPDLPSAGRVRLGDVIPSVLFAALLIALLFWQRGTSWFTTGDGEAIPFFNPERWTFWVPFIVVVLVADAVVDLIRLRDRHWTYRTATAKTALGALLVTPFLGLFGADPLFNPAFFAALASEVGTSTPGDLIQRSIVITLVAVTTWEVIEGWVKARRAAS